MCSDISRISNPFYLTSPAFPAGFRGTGTCMCRIKPVGRTWGRASIQLEHIMLSDRNVCNEALGIFITIGRKQQKVFHECSPTQLRLRQMRYLTQAKEIRVLFRRRMAMNVTAKSVVWIGIRGMSTIFSHKDVMPYQHFPWWRHQIETFSALLAFCAWNSPVPGEFHAQRPVTQSFDVIFDLRLNKRLSKQ